MSIQSVQPSCHIERRFYAQRMSEKAVSKGVAKWSPDQQALMGAFAKRLREAFDEAKARGEINAQVELGKGQKVGGGNLSRQGVFNWFEGRSSPNILQMIYICERLSTTLDHMILGDKQAAREQYAAAEERVLSLPLSAKKKMLKKLEEEVSGG
jgi:hypothetical protein